MVNGSYLTQNTALSGSFVRKRHHLRPLPHRSSLNFKPFNQSLARIPSLVREEVQFWRPILIAMVDLMAKDGLKDVALVRIHAIGLREEWKPSKHAEQYQDCKFHILLPQRLLQIKASTDSLLRAKTVIV